MLLVPSSPYIWSQSVQAHHHNFRPPMSLDPVHQVLDPSDHLLRPSQNVWSLDDYLWSGTGGKDRLGLIPEIPRNWPGCHSGPSSCPWPLSGVDRCSDGCHVAALRGPQRSRSRLILDMIYYTNIKLDIVRFLWHVAHASRFESHYCHLQMTGYHYAQKCYYSSAFTLVEAEK